MAVRAQNPNNLADFTGLVENYTSRFRSDEDQSDQKEAQREKRQKNAQTLANSYYEFASAAYENGWSTHFHYTPFAPGDTIQTAQYFYEHRLALLMGLKPGMKVLDVGCGVGGPAREIAKFVGCEVVGVTINQAQVDRAIYLTAEAGLNDRCTFVKADFMDLPFAAASFDAAYAIEATVHAPSLSTVYANIARILKPGAVFGLSEWVLTSKFNDQDPGHVTFRDRLEQGNGLSRMHTHLEAREALMGAGFDVRHEEDYSRHFERPSHEKSVVNDDGAVEVTGSPILVPFKAMSASSSTTSSSSLRVAPPPSQPITVRPSAHRPWYWPLDGNSPLATTWEDWWKAWKMSMGARWTCYGTLWILEHIGLVDRGICDAMTTLAYCVDSAREGAKEGLFSPCWWFIAVKCGQGGEDTK